MLSYSNYNLCQQLSVQKFLSNMESKNSNLSSPDDLRPFPCESCGRQFSTSAYLSQHRRIHSGIKPYACRFCDRKFTQLSHVQQHERIHTGEKPYSCFTCLKSFTQMSNLHSHQRQHMKNKPFKCAHCFMAFDLQQELEAHMESKHSSIKYNKVLICPICSKMYNSETYLKKHIERHEETSCKSLDTSHKNCDSTIKYRRQSKLISNGVEMPTNQPPGSTMDHPTPDLFELPISNHQIRPPPLPMKDGQFSDNMSMAIDISKSIVTAASGLRLNVILESLASKTCHSPFVSAAASVWSQSLLPNPTTNRIMEPNGSVDPGSMGFDLSNIARHGKSSKDSLFNHINRSDSINLLSHPPPPLPPPHLCDQITNTVSQSSLDTVSQHINIPTTAFSLR